MAHMCLRLWYVYTASVGMSHIHIPFKSQAPAQLSDHGNVKPATYTYRVHAYVHEHVNGGLQCSVYILGN